MTRGPGRPPKYNVNKLLEYLVDFEQKHGWAPSLREICEHMSYGAIRTAQIQLAVLEREGRIERGSGPRQIKVLSKRPLGRKFLPA